jgi:hypothetical protein
VPVSTYLAQPNYTETLPFMQDFSALYPNVIKNTSSLKLIQFTNFHSSLQNQSSSIVNSSIAGASNSFNVVQTILDIENSHAIPQDPNVPVVDVNTILI